MTAAPQKKKPAPNIERLQSLLDRFAAPAHHTASQDRVMPNAPEARLAFWLQEIDETVLPRRLSVDHNNKNIGYLDVSNRRLVGIVSDRVDQIAEGSVSDAEHCAVQLIHMAQTSGELHYSVSHRPHDYQETGINCSCMMLKSALGLDGNTSPLALLEQKITAEATAALTWTRSDPHPIFTGDATWHEVLQTYQTSLCDLETAGQTAPPIGSDKPEAFMIPATQDLSIVASGSQTLGFAVVVQKDAALRILNAWQISLGTTP